MLPCNNILKPMLRRILILLSILLFSTSLFAQTSVLKGIVIDKNSKEPIPYAAIVVQDGTVQLKGTSTDQEGSFKITNLPAGNWKVLCRVVGYEPYQMDKVLLKPDKVTTLKIKLSVKTGQIEEVQVVAYKIPLIDKEATIAGPPVTAEDIEKMPGRSVMSVARAVAIKSQRGNIIYLDAPGFEVETVFHVAKNGDDSSDGTIDNPFATIGKAARVARPGSSIVVHEGVYRERVDPLTPGLSENARIIFQAAPGDKVVIKGSEIINTWEEVGNGVWMVKIPNTFFGDYNPYNDVIGVDWYNDMGRDHHTGEVYLNNKSLYEVAHLVEVKNPNIMRGTTDPEGSLYQWYCEVDESFTSIYANFHEFNPNKELVEINVREACFYPSQPGMNYITVRGFYMSQAACQWSTAADEQNGLIGTHWSKGWIIEDNVITHAKNIGIALGKDRESGHRECAKNPDLDGALVYNNVIKKAYDECNWNKQNVGSHIVRNNIIFDCEKNGIHGSLGAVFSTIENNHIYDIYTKRQYGGPDLAGIKILGAIDVVIRNNHIHDAYRGLWMDWMAQGTRITGNLLYDNDNDDLFMEVNHGPFVIDNNIFLSSSSLRDWSQGGAYVHNLFGGYIKKRTVSDRETPFHKAHSTEIAGLEKIYGGDNRFFNNIFLHTGLDVYNDASLPMSVHGNLYLNEAQPYEFEHEYVQIEGDGAKIKLVKEGNEVLLKLDLEDLTELPACITISSAHLGKAVVPGLPFENPDGSAIEIAHDYFGNKRNHNTAIPGPFRALGKGNFTKKLY